MFRDSFVCRRCGRCCREYAGRFSLPRSQVLEWREKVFDSRFGRYPAIKFVSMDYTIQGVDGIFFHPETGEHLDFCPFLKCDETGGGVIGGVCSCLIYSDRPLGCRRYPFTGEFVDLSKTVCPVVRDIRSKLKKLRR
ncbi:YkgJ family cysteine cluster protein [Methanonatronarchaeum thermophilum]|uniref:YkgJ family cysteine cluster protein n=1 Tax=Methanonatronarchaeum thermophilum TaxID=1927129 RepID=UPI0013747AC1|nr:YkgJ family cysteine cluster protein [Methanonatronarchaeum thermophilum]